MHIPDFTATHLWGRLMWAHKNLAPVQPSYAIVYEDDIDSPAKVCTPAPQWLACALAGGILPPIESYLRDQQVPDGAPKEHPYAAPIGPMTEEEAMEYLLQKDVPSHVWMDTSANRPRYRITRRNLVPTDRSFRNAWSLAP